MARWGVAPPPGGRSHSRFLTNIRNTQSKFWLSYLKKTEHRALIPFSSFSEPDNRAGDDKPSVWTWFARPNRELAFFPGFWREWEGDRGTKKTPDVGNHLLFAFMTTDAGPDTAYAHPDASPVILTEPEQLELWMTAPIEEALKLQQPPPAGLLQTVLVDSKSDAPEGYTP